MIRNEPTRIPRDAVANLMSLVEKNVSSIDILSSQLGLSVEETQQLLLGLVDKGRISGQLTPDGCRFFRSDAKTSDATAIEPAPESVHMKQDARPGFIIMICGIALYIVGNLMVNYATEFEIFWSFGSALLFAGPLVLIAGLIYVSKMNPPQKLG
jgi:hypothetical protein